MTEAIWMTMGAAVFVTIVMSFGSIYLSKRSAERLDGQLAASRQARSEAARPAE